MLNNNNTKEIDQYPDLFIDGKRKYYLPVDFTIINSGELVSVNRNINNVNNDLKLFINNGNLNIHGINIDNIISNLNNLSKNRLNVNNLDEFNINLNHNYISLFKFY